MIFRLSFFFFLVLMTQGLAMASNQFSKEVIHGEKSLGDYAGSQHHNFTIGPYGQVYSQDEMLANRYTNSLFMSNWQTLSDFAKEELPAGIFCSDESMKNHYSFIKYYYRLMALSYLFESLRLWEVERACSLNVNDLLFKCRPKTVWLKELLTMARETPALQMSKLDQGKYLKLRKKSWCFNKDQGCPVEERDNKKIYKNICEADQRAFLNICSEEDSLYGMSDYTIPYWLLKRTHIMDRFNSLEEGAGCFKRFTQMMKYREKKFLALESLFEPTLEALPDNYREGVLFAYGSLQKFGTLQNIFQSHEQEKKLEQIANTDKKVMTFHKEKPKIKPKLVMVKKIPQVKRKVLKKSHSAFFQACEYREKYKLKEASVDMLKFHYDLLLTGEKKEKAHKLLSKFRQRKVLESMKKYEKLGSKQAPVPLVFLKYLLDVSDHQGLFNIVGVLGNDFFVRNDFDKKQTHCRNEFARFYFDRQSSKWQLLVLKEKPPEAKKKL